MSSSLVCITVEHPQQTQRFEVYVFSTAIVRDVKEQIARVCPGNPEASGQRLICKGRILNDSEKIIDIWTAPDEAKVIQLAVNPYAWSTSPSAEKAHEPTSSFDAIRQQMESLERESQQVQNLLDNRQRQMSEAFATPTQFQRPMAAREPPTQLHPDAINLPFFNTLPFIRRLHYKALRALSVSTPPPPIEIGNELPLISKNVARASLENMGISWNPIFDIEFPDPTDGGVVYDFTLIAGKPYLQNLTPHNTPTSRQRHALEVLAATFPLLSLPIQQSLALSAPSARNLLVNEPPAVRGRGALRFRFGINVNGRQHALNLRFALTPLLLLALRTFILLYFFSPARKPVFGILVGAYVLYEAWGALHVAMNDEPAGNRNGQPPNGNNHERGPDLLVPNDGNGDTPPVRIAAASVESAVNRLARLNLDEEQRWLEGDAQEPGFFTKMRTFVALFVLSFHPGFWSRRRAALRTREGALRTEANAAEAALTQQQTEGEDGDTNARQAREQLIARQRQRPAWIREYVERVRQGDWADE